MVREANGNDCEGICRICTEDLGYACNSKLVKMRLEHLDKKRETVFVAQTGGTVVGYVHVEKYDVLYFESMANVLGLAVAKAYQRQGWGRKLTEAAEQWAKQQGIHLLRLNSGMERVDAHKFYRAMGFREEKEQLRLLKRL